MSHEFKRQAWYALLIPTMLVALPVLGSVFPAISDAPLVLRLLMLVPIALAAMVALRFTNPWESSGSEDSSREDARS
ncbi:hypothetical protein [Demetria terragena]|uniref:hypothetical protein n=1 Tax=Demetria terragena TaxID=63959 RepID=UPI00036B5B2E|nr:hypothetical protein [Demetria terragena]